MRLLGEDLPFNYIDGYKCGFLCVVTEKGDLIFTGVEELWRRYFRYGFTHS